MEVMPDQRILAAGSILSDTTPPIMTRLLLARFEPDGDLDSTFGVNGTSVATYDSALHYAATDIAVQADGCILVLSPMGWDSICIARLTPDGKVDSTFGDNGVVYDMTGYQSITTRIDVHADGRIVVAGSAYFAADLDVFVLRLTSIGARDSSFGTDGLAVAAITSGCEENISDLEIQPNGHYLLCGSQDFCGDGGNTLLVRFEPDGSMDPGFGSNGVALFHLSPTDIDHGSGLHVMSDGRIVISGTRSMPLAWEVYLARMLPDGQMDLSFGLDGITGVPTAPTLGAPYPDLLQPMSDGTFFVCGTRDSLGWYLHTIMRFDTSGTWDASFGDAGFLDVPAANGIAWDLAEHGESGLLLAEAGWGTASVLKFASASTTGIQHAPSADGEITLFPLPVEHMLTLQFDLPHPGSVTVDLYDVNGHLVRQLIPLAWRSAGAQTEVVDLAPLVPGCYRLVLRSERTTRGTALIKL